jgi:hypothetical protein
MTTFNWSPGIGDPTLMGWLTVVLYFLAAIDCWITARRLYLERGDADGEKELRAWRSIAIAFLALGFNKQLDLQTALTEAGRVLANFQGWYDQRQSVQLAFIVLVAIICLVTAAILVRWARNAPAPTLFALAGSIMVICYVLVRAASFHHIDRFIGETVLGFRWNWILEMGGISVVLAASYWRRSVAGQPKSVRTRIAGSRTRRSVSSSTAQGPGAGKEHPMPQIWLTYAELSDLLKCELSQVRQAVIDHSWSQRKSGDGRMRVKLSPALAHQFMMNYATNGRDLSIEERIETLREL